MIRELPSTEIKLPSLNKPGKLGGEPRQHGGVERGQARAVEVRGTQRGQEAVNNKSEVSIISDLHRPNIHYLRQARTTGEVRQVIYHDQSEAGITWPDTQGWGRW